jgi:hypothetical protein
MLDVETYGADPNATPAQNGAAFQAFADDLAAQGGEGRIRRKYIVDRQIVFGNAKPFRLVGEGPGSSRVTREGSNTAIVVTMASHMEACAIEGFSIACTGAPNGSNVGLTITQPAISSGIFPGCAVRDMHFIGDNMFEDGFSYPLHIKDCWNLRLENIHVNGIPANNTFAVHTGISLEQCMEPFLRGINIYHVQHAMRCYGSAWSEGFNLAQFAFVGCFYGIYMPAAATIASGTEISSGHINATAFPIWVENRRKMKVRDTLLAKTHTASGFYWQGIKAVNCQTISVLDNEMFGYPGLANANDPVVLDGCTDCRVAGNLARDFSFASPMVILAGASSNNWITGNKRHGPIGAPVNIGSGSGNVIVDGAP